MKTVRNLHLLLASELYEEIRKAAAEERKTATEVARGALRAWVEARRQERIAGEIAAYAARMAGTGADLDEDLERAGVEHLLGRSRRSRRRS